MSRLERIICHGNRTLNVDLLKAQGKQEPNHIECVDGFKLSVIAGGGAYCEPRPDFIKGDGTVPENYGGPYTAVEVGYPSDRPEPWDEWKEYADEYEEGFDPTDTVYGYVPVELVRALVASHGGEA